MLFIHDKNVFIVPCIFKVLCWAMGTFKRRRRKMRGWRGAGKNKRRDKEKRGKEERS